MDGETLTLDAIKSGLKFRKALAKALLGEIRNIQVASEHRPFDVWALVLLRSIGDPKAQVEVEKVSSPRAWQRPPPEAWLQRSLWHTPLPEPEQVLRVRGAGAGVPWQD